MIKPTLNKVFQKDLTSYKMSDYLIEYHLSSIFGAFNYWINNKNISIDEMFVFIQEVVTKGVFTVIKEL